jgi:hypothetical protein
MDNSPPVITVFDSGVFYYNSKSVNELFCGDASAGFFLELWSRGFKVEKACQYDTVVAGQGLGGGNYDSTTVDGAVSSDEIPSHCEVIYRFHEAPVDQPNWVPVDADCGTAAYGGVVITLDEMTTLFKQWCVSTVHGELCNSFTQTGLDGEFHAFSMEYKCTSTGGYHASACRVVENVENTLVCHSPTPTPTKVPTAFPSASPTKFPTATPTASPTSGYVIIVDLTVADSRATVIRDTMIEACDMLDAEDVLLMSQRVVDISDLTGRRLAGTVY